MFARRGAPLEEQPPPSPRSPEVEEARCEAGAYRVVALIGLLVSVVGALAVILSRLRYLNPPHRQMVDLEGTLVATFGTQLGVTALAFGLPLAIGGAVLWLRARRDGHTEVAALEPGEVPRAVVVHRRRA